LYKVRQNGVHFRGAAGNVDGTEKMEPGEIDYRPGNFHAHQFASGLPGFQVTMPASQVADQANVDLKHGCLASNQLQSLPVQELGKCFNNASF
jgi:hypothetical protein